MAIIQYPGYITKEQAAAQQRIQVRAVNAQIRSKRLAALKIDGFTFVEDTNSTDAAPPGINLASLEWVYRCARKHKMSSDLLYEQIIMGNITGVIVANRVFIINNENSLVLFLMKNGKYPAAGTS